jgi:50S ribosomal protein L16 3-hydroxylase
MHRRKIHRPNKSSESLPKNSARRARRTCPGKTMNIIQQMFGVHNEYFLEKHWPTLPYVLQGDMNRFTELSSLEELHDIEKLLSVLNDSVDLLFPGGKRISVSDKFEALSAHTNGEAMIYIKNMEVIPAISSACDDLAHTLAVPRQYVSCEAFAANRDVEVATHFDHETNFMIQIKGEKTWRFAENTSLPDPIYPFFPNNPNRFYQNGTHPYTGAQLPREMPTKNEEHLVRPGTTTFMPRGYWHSTTCHEESFSIGFVINPPTIADIISYAVLEQLHAVELLRAHPLETQPMKNDDIILNAIQEGLNKMKNLSIELSSKELLHRYKSSKKGNTRTLSPI